MVVVGIVAIVVGAFLLLMCTQGRVEIVAIDDVASAYYDDASDPMQTTLGETLVNIAILERAHAGEIKKAVTRLNQATMTAHRIDRSAHEQITSLEERAKNHRIDKAARAEFVKGRSVVNSTTRAIRNGSLRDQSREEYDHRMVHVAAEAAEKINHEFEMTEESNLGRAIVAETQSHMSAAHRNQEQVGAVIVQVALVQDEYRRAWDTAQEQLGLLVSVRALGQL
jgi:hypothetical protein